MSEEQDVTSGKEIFLVSSKIKAYIKSKGCMTSSDVIDGLNEKVIRLIDEAIERTNANKRTTVRASDF
ncbi:MAG: hypothetical protein K8R21_03745 [Leptospira sp.]|nr:hypothetical protein [Leptospira sp.]